MVANFKRTFKHSHIPTHRASPPVNENGKWRLSPAYDVTYSFNPAGVWTGKHQMSINGKRDNFLKEDLVQVGKEMGIKSCNKIINEIVEVVLNWSHYAKDVGIENSKIKSIGATHRLFY